MIRRGSTAQEEGEENGMGVWPYGADGKLN